MERRLNKPGWASGWRWYASALAVGLLALYMGAVEIPSGQRSIGIFATYYTSAYIVAYMPRELSHAYETEWFNAQFAAAGIHNFRDRFFFQPPTMALIGLPLLALPPQRARLVWSVANLLMLVGGLAILGRSLNLPALSGVWAAPVCLAYTPIRENFILGQAYLLIFLALCILFWAILAPTQSHGRLSQTTGGIALGLALVSKTAFVWLWPLLLLAKRWRLLIGAAITAAVVTLISLPWIGVEAWQTYVGLLPALAIDPIRYVTAYQTVTSLVGHLLVYDPRWNPAPVADWPAAAHGLTLAIQLATLAASAAWVHLNDARHHIRALSMALAAALMTANAPVGEGYHSLVVLPSLLVAAWYARRARYGRRAWAALLTAGALLSAPLPYRSPQLTTGWLALLAYPRLYGAYALWLWLGWALASSRKREDTGSGPSTVALMVPPKTEANE
jgi:hypothetical protein